MKIFVRLKLLVIIWISDVSMNTHHQKDHVCFLNEFDRDPKNLAKVIDNPKEFLQGPAAKTKGNQNHVVIVGGGIAGLLSAYMLLESGHKVTLLESSDRLGGRIYTYYGDGYYGDVGAMRFPPFHLVLHQLLKTFNVPFANFTTTHKGPASYAFIGGKYYPSVDIIGDAAKEESLRELYKLYQIEDIPKDENGKVRSPTEVVQTILSQEIATAEHCANDQTLSMFIRDKLRALNLDENISYLWGIVNGLGPLLAGSLDEFITDSDGSLLRKENPGSLVEIVNGASVLVDKVFSRIKKNPNLTLRKKSQVTRIVQNPRGSPAVTVFYKEDRKKSIKSVSGDFSILTPTMRAMQLIEFQPPLNYRKQHAFSSVHYTNAIKIFLKFKEPFWSYGKERGNKAMPIPYGPELGGAVGLTDGRTHQIYYPSHDFHGPVLIGAYTWDDHADFFNSLSDEESVEMALSELVKIHGEIAREQFEEGFIYMWGKNRHSRGGFIHQFPNEKYTFMEYIQQPDGHLLFSGEFANKNFPGWIEAAAESAIRTLVNLWPKVYDAKFKAEESKYFTRPGRFAKNKRRRF